MHYAGLHWYNKGDLTRAEFALQVAVLEDPSSLKVHLDYLGIIHDLKQWEVLIEAGEQASLVFPLEPLIFLYYGNGHKELKHYKEAITLFKNGLAVLIDAPKTRAALLNELAFSYREFGEKEESYDTFEKSLIHNSSPYVMNNHAYYLATDNQRIQDALKWSTKANELVPNEPNFMDTQALILHLLVRNLDALDWIVEAQALLNSPEAVFLEREGDIRYSLGESERAFELWERAIVAGGGKTRLNEKLNRPVIGKE
jgi:tetratricopeptide (TPR) repeat protein